MNLTISTNVTADIHPSDTILTGMSIYFTMFIIAIISFEILQHFFTGIYKSRACGRSESGNLCPMAAESNFGWKTLGWIFPVLRVTDDEILAWCGLDTLCFLRFLRMGQKFALVGIGFSIILFPVYATGTNPSENERKEIDPLERITMSNLSQGEGRLWASVLVMYALTAIAMYLFITEYKEYVRRRHEFLSKIGPSQYSILINDLHSKYLTKLTLTEYLKQLFPAQQVQSVHVFKACGSLDEKCQERIEIRNLLERAFVEFDESGGKKRPQHKLLKISVSANPIGESVDSITYYSEKLKQLNDEIKEEILGIEEQEKEMAAQFMDETTTTGARNSNSKIPMRPSAFVSFNKLTAAQSAQQVLQTEDPLGMQIVGAPHPSDVVWENIGNSIQKRRAWELVSWGIAIAIILFWTIPTTFVTSFATVEKLSENIPGLKKIFEDIPWLEELVKQLTPLGLIAMTSLADWIYGYLSKREGHPSGSQVAVSHFSKLVYFEIFQIFFVSVIAGTILESLKEILKEPQMIVTLLGTTMPNQSTLFISYLIVQIGLKLSMELLRVVPICMGLIFKIFSPKLTPRERKATSWLGFKSWNDPGDFSQRGTLPDYFLCILLIFAFIAIAPLLCYFAGVFLLASDIIFRRQVLFTYNPNLNSSGLYWPKLHNFLVGALFLSQLTFLGLITLKLAKWPIFFSTLLPFVTIAYYIWMNPLWPRVAQNLPLSHCVKIDERRGNELEKEFNAYLNVAYVQPALREIEPLRPELKENGEFGLVVKIEE